LHSPDPDPFLSAAFEPCFHHVPSNSFAGDQTSVDESSVVSVQIGDSFDHKGQCLIIKSFREDGAVLCGNESDSDNDDNSIVVLKHIEYVRKAVKINLI
jgi:riboflavin synthase alpha subunit